MNVTPSQWRGGALTGARNASDVMDLSCESPPLKTRRVHLTTERNRSAAKSAHRLLAAADIYPPFPRYNCLLLSIVQALSS